MNTGKFAVIEDRTLIRRFEYWSAFLIGPGMHVVIRPNRAINGSQDLSGEERAELYQGTIPATEQIIGDAMKEAGQGDIDILQQWTGQEMWLRTPTIKSEMRVKQVYAAYQRAIDAAA